MARQASSYERGLAVCLNTAMPAVSTHDAQIAALEALCEREGGYKMVAETIGASGMYLWQILHKVPLKSGKPRGIGRELRAKLDNHFRGWLELQHSVEGVNKPRGSVAHILSDQQWSYSPQINWEAVVSHPALPSTFRVAMPDESMSPRVRRGDVLEFSTTESARSGDGILVRDQAGALYFRIFRQRRPGSWEAHPINTDFLALESERDGLTVMGVMVGAPRNRWG